MQTAARVLFVLTAAAYFAAFSACTRPLAEMMTSTPNRFNPLAEVSRPWPSAEEIAGADETFWVEVGPPRAKLSVSVVEPDERYKQPKATVLVLHGIFMRGLWMMPQAKMLSSAGYRAVLVDLRGHGRSGGDRLGFGRQEAEDLSQVIDELERRDLLAGRLGVYGFSYGATAAIHLAGIDDRVDAVVAVAPFCTIREEIPRFGRVMIPGAGWLVPNAVYQNALDEAGRLAEFDPDRDTALAALQQTSAQVLLIHGRGDLVIPHADSVRLHESAPQTTELVSVPWTGHITAWADPSGEVADNARRWFEGRLGGK